MGNIFITVRQTILLIFIPFKVRTERPNEGNRTFERTFTKTEV